MMPFRLREILPYHDRQSLEFRGQFVIFARLVPVLGLILFVLFGAVLRPFETEAQAAATHALRYYLVLPYFVFVMLLGMHRRYRRFYPPLIWVGVLLQGVCTLAMLRVFDPDSTAFIFYFFGFVMSFVGAFTLTGLSLFGAVSVSALLFCLFEGLILFKLTVRDSFRNVLHLFIFMFLGFGFISAYLVRRSMKKVFAARRELRIERTKSTRMARTLLNVPVRLQSALLPAIPSLPGAEADYFCAPAEDVGGDYVDIISAADAHWLVIGDVSGKGLTAGLIMVMTQASIHTAVTMLPDASPARILECVNRTLTHNIAQMDRDLSKYVTLSLLRLEQDWRIAHSGLHQDIVVYRKSGDYLEFIPSIGSWLGLPQWQGAFGDGYTRLEAGDILFLYTDGLTEIFKENVGNDSAGRLFSILRKYAHAQLGEIKEKIILEMDLKNAGDDAAFILLRRTA